MPMFVSLDDIAMTRGGIKEATRRKIGELQASLRRDKPSTIWGLYVEVGEILESYLRRRDLPPGSRRRSHGGRRSTEAAGMIQEIENGKEQLPCHRLRRLSSAETLPYVPEVDGADGKSDADIIRGDSSTPDEGQGVTEAEPTDLGVERGQSGPASKPTTKDARPAKQKGDARHARSPRGIANDHARGPSCEDDGLRVRVSPNFEFADIGVLFDRALQSIQQGMNEAKRKREAREEDEPKKRQKEGD